jgi:exosortase A
MGTLFRIDVRSQREVTGCAKEISNTRALQQALAILGASWVLVIYLFSDAAFAAVAQWKQSQTFSHGFLIFPITIYLIWRQREQIRGLVLSPNYWGLPILALVGSGWLLGHLGAVLVVQQLAVVAMLQALVFTIIGWPVTHALFFPLSFLIFAVPFGEDLVPPLQDYTALFTVKALQLSGIPVYRDGWLLVTPTSVWEVAEACAGIRYVIPSVILGCLFSYYGYRSWGRRLCFVLFCFFAAIAANGIRAYGIVVVAHLTNNRLAVGVDHLIAGWVFHSLVVFILFWIGLRWREPIAVASKGDAAKIASKATAMHVGSPRVMVLTAVGAVALLALAPLTAQSLLQPVSVSGAPMVSAPAVAAPWQAVDGRDDNWKPNFRGADAELWKSYSSEHQQVDLLVGYYRAQQRQGAELVGAANALIDEKNWRRMRVGSAQVVADGAFLSVKETVIRSTDRIRLVWSWYWVGGKYTANPYFAKFLEIKSLLLREQGGSALIALSVDVENGNLREAAGTLRSFLGHLSLVQAFTPSATRDDR